jgi:hypothetical protein
MWRIPRAPAAPLSDEQKDCIHGRWLMVARGKFLPQEGSWLHTLMLFDFVGATLLLACIVCLLLARAL